MKKLLLPLLLLTLTGCKIDLTIIGIGEVKTASDSIDCASGSTGDCQQQYVTDKTQCVGYEVGPPEVIPPNCTLVTTSVNETFTALPGDNSNFGGWGNFCFDLADLSCQNTITEVDADNPQQLSITATFDPEPTPQDATYTYNHLGQRASKTVAGVKTHFVYSDIDGQLLGEYKSNGDPIREYVYLEGERVAMYDYTTVDPRDSSTQKAIVYFHNDHVGQVQFAFSSDGQMIYERIQTPFGETMGEMNVYSVQVPVRFPGQYADAETGYSDNWNRTYDSSIGRYVQSDPIGLRGGINTFGYVGQNPLRFVDLFGLAPGDAYANDDMAGYAAVNDINPTSINEGLEYAGRIYKNPDGSYSYTPPNRGTHNSSVPPDAPDGTENAGRYHTHGEDEDGYNEEIFSDDDKQNARDEGVPSYLGTPDGGESVQKYDPNDPICYGCSYYDPEKNCWQSF